LIKKGCQIKERKWCWQASTTATAKGRHRLWGKGYGDFSVAFFTIGRNSTSMWSAVPIANLNFISPALPF